MQAQIVEYNQNKNSSVEYTIKPSELFDNDVYLEEITDVICISLAELPNLLNICEIIDVLLHVNKGPIIVSWIVANMPDTLQEGKPFISLKYHIFILYYISRDLNKLCKKKISYILNFNRCKYLG